MADTQLQNLTEATTIATTDILYLKRSDYDASSDNYYIQFATIDNRYLLESNNLSDLDNASTARTNLGVAIGSNVQAYDATLTSLASLGTAADKLAYTTGVDTWAETGLTAFARSFLDDANEATFKATVNLEIGTDVQAYDPFLTSIASLGTAADRMIYTTGVDTAAETVLTAFARTVLDDADAGTFRTTIGAGTTTLPVVDETALVFKTGTPANTLTFDVNAFSAARTWTFPDATTTVAGLGVANVFTAKQQMVTPTGTAVPVLQLSVNGSETGGLFFIPVSLSRCFVTAGCEYNGSNFVARDTTAGRWEFNSANQYFYVDSVLTIGNTYTPTLAMMLHSSKRLKIGSGISTTQPTGVVQIESTHAALIGLIVRGYTSATANLQEWQDINANVLAQVEASGAITVKPFTATNNAILNVATVGANVTGVGVGAAGFGPGLLATGESTTTVDTSMGRLHWQWVVPTHASRTVKGTLTAYDTAERTCIQWQASGTAPMVGFYGVTPVVRAAAYTPSNVTPDRSYDADTVLVAELADVVGTLIADLQLLGLIS